MLRIFLLLFLFVTFSFHIANAQDIKVLSGIGFNNPLIKNVTYKVNDTDVEIEKYSFSKHYSSNSSYFFETSYRFPVLDNSPLHLLTGFNYEANSLKLEEKDAVIFGETISQSKYSLLFGSGTYLSNINQMFFLYTHINISAVTMEGEGKIPLEIENQTVLIDGVSTYRQAMNIKFTLGFDFEKLLSTNFFLGMRASYEIGSVIYSKTDLFSNNDKIGHLAFDKKFVIQNNSYSIDLFIGYEVELL